MTLLTTTKEMGGSCAQAPSALCMLHEIVFCTQAVEHRMTRLFHGSLQLPIQGV